METINRIGEVLTDSINVACGVVVTVMTFLFGDYWFLFAGFLGLNIIDYITGILKARYAGEINSVAGAKGIIKKTGYWLTIAIAFYISLTFQRMGTLIGVDLSFVVIFGWLTLALFIINEIRSVLENLVKIGVPVPAFLLKGMQVAEEAIKNKTGDSNDGDR